VFKWLNLFRDQGATPHMASQLAPAAAKYAPLYGINSALRVKHFIGQTGHETMGYRYLREIASGAAYEGRKDLGNIQPGDGRKFRGRGLIQVTGRSNYAAMSVRLGLPLLQQPELLEQPEHAIHSAMAWWRDNGCNELADTGSIQRLTRRINGGTNGLDDRIRRTDRAARILSL
jgi:putative chitinase